MARIETVSKKETRICLEKLMKTRRKHRLNHLLVLELLARFHEGFLEILQAKTYKKIRTTFPYNIITKRIISFDFFFFWSNLLISLSNELCS